MHCTKQAFSYSLRTGLRRFTYLAAAVVVAGCGGVSLKDRKAESPTQAPSATPGEPAVSLKAPTRSRNWDDFKVQAAKRMVAANPKGTYVGAPQDVLLAIPVLETELNSDGSIKRIKVLRYPGQARDTTQLAINAVRRAAPYGDVSRLPKPWVFTEAFLFNDDRRFKPRTLDN